MASQRSLQLRIISDNTLSKLSTPSLEKTHTFDIAIACTDSVSHFLNVPFAM